MSEEEDPFSFPILDPRFMRQQTQVEAKYLSKAPYELTKVYWIGSSFWNILSTITILYSFWQFLYNPAYKKATVRAFIPKLLGVGIWVLAFVPHHGMNSLKSREWYEATSIEEMSRDWHCIIASLGYISIIVQLAGLCFLAWVPLHIVKEAQKMSPPSAPTKHIALTTIGSAAVGCLWEVLHIPDFGMWRGFYCGTFSHQSHSAALGMMLSTVVSLALFLRFQLRTNSELKSLVANAKHVHLEAEIQRIKRWGTIFLLFCVGGFTPYAILVLLEYFFKIQLPDFMFIICGWLIKMNGFFDGLVIWFYVREATKVQSHRHEDVKIVSFSKQSSFGQEKSVKEGELLQSWNRGISLHYLLSFVQDNKIKMDMTIQEVMVQYVKIPTSDLKVPYVNLIADCYDEAGHCAVAAAEFFVSHCWADTFGLLMEQLLIFYGQQGREGPMYLWIDIFAVNQHDLFAPGELDSLSTVIGKTNNLVLTINPWYKPQTLTRVWCLWEILQGVRRETSIHLVMPKTEQELFLQVARESFHEVSAVFSRIDAEHAQATNESDKVAIFKEITESVGFEQLNSSIEAKLQHCLRATILDNSF